jgi:hypothetical protein
VLYTAAPTEHVWRALADVESWPRWMSSYSSVRRLDPGPLRVGARARVAQPGLRQSIYTVTALRIGREFTWENKLPGILTVARHVARTGHNGGCHIVLTVMQTGALAGAMSPFLGAKVRRFLTIEADGLVRVSEARNGLGGLERVVSSRARLRSN